MALQIIEGFDLQYFGDLSKKGWTPNISYNALSVNGGRRGGGALQTQNNSQCYKGLTGNPATVIAGAAINLNSTPSGAYGVIFLLWQGGAYQCSLLYNTTTHKLECYRGYGAYLLGTSTNTLSPTSGYHYIELKATIHGLTGAMEVRVDGVVWLTLTGVNTLGATSAWCDAIGVGAGTSGTYGYVDDVYVLDTTGSTNNTYLGDCRVDTLLPTGAGSNADFSYTVPGTAHRYWRITNVLFANSVGSYTGAYEVQMRTTSGGSTVTTGGTAIANDASNGAAANAFDANTATQWATGSGTVAGLNAWIGYDFGAGNNKEIVEVSIKAGGFAINGFGAQMTVQYSDDGTTWFTAWEINTSDWLTLGETRVFTRPANAYNIAAACPLASLENINSSTLNAISSFAMADLAATSATIFGVQASACLAKDDAGARGAATFIKSGSTTDVGATLTLGTGYAYAAKLYEADPNTSAAWTESGVNAMEAGAKLTV